MTETNQNEFEHYSDFGSEISTLIFEEGGKNLENFEHHGVKGMKWYQHLFGKMQSHAKYAKKGSTSEKSSKNYKTMTDEELQKELNRLRLENQYRDEKKKQEPESKVKKYIVEVAKEAGKRFITSYMQKLGERLGAAIDDSDQQSKSKSDSKTKKPVATSSSDKKPKDKKPEPAITEDKDLVDDGEEWVKKLMANSKEKKPGDPSYWDEDAWAMDYTGAAIRAIAESKKK